LPKRHRSILTEREADQIAQKLDAEVREGRNHALAIIRVNGKEVGRFGIQRGVGVGHDYIPKQIHINMKMALNLARCSKYRADYELVLRNTPFYPTS
jgi:hypothetical protein